MNMSFLPLAIAVAAALVGCAGSRDFVTVTPVRFVPIVGAGGPSCQGLCPTSKDQAEKYRVEVGYPTFQRIKSEAKAQGKAGDMAFLEFARREVETRGFCVHAVLAPASTRQPISTVEGWSVFWTTIACDAALTAITEASGGPQSCLPPPVQT